MDITRQRGFTLIELITTLAVGLILLSVGIPNMRQLLAGNQQRSEINTLVTHFHLAGSEAVKRATRVVLCPSDDHLVCDGSFNWGDGFIIFADENANRRRDPDEELLRIYQNGFESQISINSTSGRRRLTYQADGSSPGSNVTITLCHPQNIINPKAIIISNNGRTRISERRPDGSALTCS